ncbi:MAG: hypothetical protein HY010_19610 [Acidobacteria bacterium]|nr:hypothetical protein [Acidobacteriota bacterium]
MNASPKQHAIRRSTRLPLEIPILITSLDPARDFSEECKTTLVNAHGCGLITQHALPRDLPVRLEIVSAKRHVTARVADVVSLGGEPETWLLGLELDTPGNFWGIEYAPSDWKIEEAPQPAASSPHVPEPAAATQPAPAGRRWRLTDISAGACYLEAVDLLPVDTPVLISVRVASSECLLDGVVRASHPNLGMGIEFTSIKQDHRARAEELIAQLTTHREVPRVFVGRKEGPRAVQPIRAAAPSGATDDPFDALLTLIRQGDSMPIEKFLEDLRAQRLGDRAEPRIDVTLPVEISGTDIHGKSFVETVRTSNVSRRGAQLEGVQAKLRVNDIVSIASGDRREDFRVSWVGASLTSLAGQIGVIVIEQNTTLWDPAIQVAARQQQQEPAVPGAGKRK